MVGQARRALGGSVVGSKQFLCDAHGLFTVLFSASYKQKGRGRTPRSKLTRGRAARGRACCAVALPYNGSLTMRRCIVICSRAVTHY